MKIKEKKDKKEIVQVRNFREQLKVFLIWWLLWNPLHQNTWAQFIKAFVCGYEACSDEAFPVVRVSKILLGAITSVIQMHWLMKRRARDRWIGKYKLEEG